MKKLRPLTGKAMLLALATLTAAQSKAQYTNYFTNQVLSNATSTTAGTFNGGTFSIANPNGATLSTWTAAPGSLPANSGFPASGPVGISMNSGGAAATITISFSTPLTPADHFYLEDMDNAEVASVSFLDASNNVINPTNFRAAQLSTNFNAAFSMTKSTTAISINAGSGLQTEPLLEIIPNVVVNSVRINFTNVNAGGFGFLIGRNKPVLTQSLSTNTITRGRSATLTYTLSGINNNPIYQLGFTNTLPTGWKIYGVPVPTGSYGTFSTPANGSTVTLSGVDNAFATSNGLMTASWTVEVSNADNQMNSSCGSNPAAFTNSSTNYAVSTTDLTNSVTPVCMTITAPLPLELSSFTAAIGDCSPVLRWESAYESQLSAYEIQRSSDGSQWTTVGRVAALNRQAPQQYRFIDEHAPQGSLQYRLRIAGMGDDIEYSRVAGVRNACENGRGFGVSPNPAAGAIRISLGTTPAAGAQVTLALYDLAGRTVARINATGLSGSTASAQLPQLAPGLYILQAAVDGVTAGTTRLSIR